MMPGSRHSSREVGTREDWRAFGNVLRTLRIKAGVTRTELAVKIGLMRRRIVEIERGQRPPLSVERINQAADFLGCPRDELIQLHHRCYSYFQND